MFEVNAVYEGSAVFDGKEHLGTFIVILIDKEKKLIVVDFEGEYVAIKASHRRKFLEPNIKGNEWIIYS